MPQPKTVVPGNPSIYTEAGEESRAREGAPGLDWDFEQQLGNIFRAHEKRKDEVSQRLCAEALRASKTAALQVSQRLEKKAGSAFARRINGDMLDLKAERWMHAFVLQHKFTDSIKVAFEFKAQAEGPDLAIDVVCNGESSESHRFPIAEVDEEGVRRHLEQVVVEGLKSALAV